MQAFRGAVTALLLLSAVLAASGKPQSCPPPGFDAVAGLNLTQYIQGPWYVQQQQPIVYQKASNLFCVRALYEPVANKRGVFEVKNYANEGSVNGPVLGSSASGAPRIIATVPKPGTPSKLKVGPAVPGTTTQLPLSSGDYWIVATGSTTPETYDWAIISGGAPSAQGKDGKCQTGRQTPLLRRFQTNGIGLWLFSRKPVDPEATAVMVEAARGLGFDTSVLVPVVQQGCLYNGADA